MDNSDHTEDDSRKRKRSDERTSYNVQSSSGSSNDASTFLRLRGLPFNVTRRDIINFFDGYNVDGNSEIIIQIRNTDDKPTGEGYVQLPSNADVDMALQNLQRKCLGSRYIELFRANPSDMKNWKTRRL